MKRLILALALCISGSAFANCGNDKPVGNGCTTDTTTTVSPTQGQAQAMAQAQAQLQLQAQQAIAQGGNANATAKGGNALSIAGGGQGGKGGKATAQGGTASGGNALASQSLNGSGNSSSSATNSLGNSGNSSSINTVSTALNEARNPVSTAYAPQVNNTVNCAVAVSGGFSVAGFSGSAGSAYRDENCVVLEQVKTVAALGDPDTAMEMLCTQPLYNEARIRMGKPCRYVIPRQQAPILSTVKDY